MMSPGAAGLVVLLLEFLLSVAGDKHSLLYLYTIQSQNTDHIYECTSVTLLDDSQINFYNSSDQSRAPELDWLKKIPESDWNRTTEKLDLDRQWINKLIDFQMNELRHKKSEGHVLQWRHGCEGRRRSDGSVTVLNFINEFGYDGEDLIRFDCTSKRWMTSEKIMENWHTVHLQTAVLKCDQCVEMLEMYLKYKTTETTPEQIRPDVYVTKKKSVRDQSKLTFTCLATGFYPRDIEMSLRKVTTLVPEHLETSSGVRPNGDGTFQLWKRVEIQEEEDAADYSCSVSHSSLRDPVIKQWGSSHSVIIGAVSAVAVTVVLTFILGVVLFVLRKKGLICKGGGGQQSNNNTVVRYTSAPADGEVLQY